MSIDQKLREHLSPRAAGEGGFDRLPDDLWKKVERRISGRGRNTLVRLGTIAIAAAASLATLLWLVSAFTGHSKTPAMVHPTVPPPTQLTFSKIQLFGEVDGIVTNHGTSATGAQITCDVRDPRGFLLTPFIGSVSYIAPGRSVAFVANPQEPLTTFDEPATATCHAVGIQATPPPPPPPPAFHPTQVVFWDSQNGIVTGFVGGPNVKHGTTMVQSTSDGGRTWATIMQSKLAANFGETTAFGADHLWAVGLVGTSGKNNVLLSSADGGKTWAQISKGWIERVSFTSATDGWAVWGAGLATTTDGGRTWSSETTTPCPQMGLWPIDVSFASPTHGWLVCTGTGGAGSVFKAVLETAT